MSEIVGLALQFATQNCLCCYSNLNLCTKFYAEIVTHLPHINLRTLYTLIILYYNDCYSITTNYDPIYDLIRYFHTKTVTQL